MGQILNIVTQINSAVKSNRAVVAAANTVFSLHRKRIFEEGLAADDTKIGTYSTRPTFISKANQARNTGQTSFPGGYAQYKSMIGKNPGFIILRNFDQMYMDYGVYKDGSNVGVGFQNPHNGDKARWIQQRKGKLIFAHNKKELDLFQHVLTFELRK